MLCMLTYLGAEFDLLGGGLPLLNWFIPWERGPILESVPKMSSKGPRGRKSYDRVLLFNYDGSPAPV